MSQETYDPSNKTTRAETQSPSATDYAWSDLITLWGILHAGRRKILIASVAGLILALPVALLLPKYYTATATFIPPASASSAMSFIGAQIGMAGVGGLASSHSADQQIGILQSRSVSMNMISRFDLQHVYGTKKESGTERALAAHAVFEADPKDGFIKVSVTDHDPKRAQDMANAYIDELHAANGRLALTESSQRRLFFEQQLAQEKEALEAAEDDLQKTQEQTGLIAPAPQTAIEIQSIAGTRADIEAREVELSGLLQGSTEQDPAVIRLRSEIASLEGQLSQMMIGGGNLPAGMPASKVPALQLEYARKQREVSYHEAIFGILSTQYESARLDESREAPVVQVLDPAVLPDTKSGPHRSLIMLAGLLLGAIGSSLWLLFRAYRVQLASLFSQPA
jgi:tyrosine-protein kinase Etk/Wzc